MKSGPDIAGLRAFLQEELRVPVKLDITRNRRTMVSYRWTPEGLILRVHEMFLAEDPRLWRTLAAFCRKPTKAVREALDEHIGAHSDELTPARRRATRLLQLESQGQHHDLAEFLHKLNAKHFKRLCDARITWGKEPVKKKRRNGIQLGSYDPETNIIRIHRVLDAPWVPRYVLESLIFHEMLHWMFRPRHDGTRRVIHGRAFREAEIAHPAYERSRLWMARNLEKLLKG